MLGECHCALWLSAPVGLRSRHPQPLPPRRSPSHRLVVLRPPAASPCCVEPRSGILHALKLLAARRTAAQRAVRVGSPTCSRRAPVQQPGASYTAPGGGAPPVVCYNQCFDLEDRLSEARSARLGRRAPAVLCWLRRPCGTSDCSPSSCGAGSSPRRGLLYLLVSSTAGRAELEPPCHGQLGSSSARRLEVKRLGRFLPPPPGPRALLETCLSCRRSGQQGRNPTRQRGRAGSGGGWTARRRADNPRSRGRGERHAK